MDEVKFTEKDMEKFNDRIQNCLEDERCLKIFQHYLEISDKPVLSNALKLWIEADKADSFDEDMFLDLIEEVQGFNDKPLSTFSNCEEKLKYVKMETCRILEKILPHLIEYLNINHKI